MAVNWQGGVSGLATGAGAGSPFGPWGTAIGGGLGLVSGLFGSKGSKDKFKQVGKFTPEQEQALQQYYQNPITDSDTYQSGNQYIQNLLSGDPGAYAAFESPLMRQFQEQTIPGIAERFAGAGTGAGAGGSSALYNSLGKAASDFSSNIAALRGGMQMQALPQALQYAQQPYSNLLGGLGVNGFENIMMQGQPGIQNTFGMLAPSALQAGMSNNWGFKPNNKSSSKGFGSGQIPAFAQGNQGTGMSSLDQMNQFGFSY